VDGKGGAVARPRDDGVGRRIVDDVVAFVLFMVVLCFRVVVGCEGSAAACGTDTKQRRRRIHKSSKAASGAAATRAHAKHHTTTHRPAHVFVKNGAGCDVFMLAI
jgi:hypothetical protein